MSYSDFEKMFNRAFALSMSKRKFILVFPVLAFCGFVGKHIFLCSGLLLFVGVLLSRIFYKEVKGNELSYKTLLKESFPLLVNVTYLTLPLILTYFILKAMVGVFSVIQLIPGLAELLSFAPFLLVLGLILLGLFSLFALFFATPHIALAKEINFELGKEVMQRFVANPFGSLFLFFCALLPLLIVAGILSVAAMVTGPFVMLPFTALMTPFVIFFFNFSMESYSISRRAKVHV